MLARVRTVEPKIPIELRKAKEPVSISALLASLQIKRYFDATKLLIKDFAASLGLSVTPKLRFLKCKLGVNLAPTEANHGEKGPHDVNAIVDNRKLQLNVRSDDVEDKVLIPNESSSFDLGSWKTELGTRVLNKKKLKINLHQPSEPDSVHLDVVEELYNKLREETTMAKIKESITEAATHPAISCGIATCFYGLFLLKRPSGYLICNTRRIFVQHDASGCVVDDLQVNTMPMRCVRTYRRQPSGHHDSFGHVAGPLQCFWGAWATAALEMLRSSMSSMKSFDFAE
ncbi:hypothetical protein ZIOFF_011051 [Zingiber officinale]|uniref:Uncharacterized protein n=1 Tax=Zingiber officinale TaxID=94328 RepID=A0A8J5M084_ZINOF|nr:hypothetical protein ZIOFF_011051 [Zingiber officinale]